MKYDLVIIGGGPAGMMAALQASESGRRVLLLEKNGRLGIKLLITGGGRCNVTNNIPDYHILANSYGPSGRFLLSTFSRFGVLETLAFFNDRGVKLKTEADNKVFPVSDLAVDVLSVFIKGINAAGGIIRTGSQVKELVTQDNKIEKLILTSGEEIVAENFLIATGGLSYPVTGSTGDGYRWVKNIGHTIKPLRPALMPILVIDKFISGLEGLSLADIILTLKAEGKKIAQENGPIIFTALGVSGPAALNISRQLDFNSYSDFELRLDFKPEYSREDLDKILINIFSGSNKLIKNSLEEILPGRLANIILALLNLDENSPANSLSKLNRKKILDLIKDFKLIIKNVVGYERAMVTVGGIDLREINPKTMRSKLISNLFLAGEILDIAGPTGGYNLQSAWSTGFIAGKN